MFDYFRWKITLHITYLGSKQQPLGCRFCDAGVKGWGGLCLKITEFYLHTFVFVSLEVG